MDSSRDPGSQEEYLKAGFFLLKGSFSCHRADLGVPAPGFCLCKPRGKFIVKGEFRLQTFGRAGGS